VHYSRHRPTAATSDNDQCARPASPLVGSSKTKPCQFSSVTSLCTRLNAEPWPRDGCVFGCSCMMLLWRIYYKANSIDLNKTKLKSNLTPVPLRCKVCTKRPNSYVYWHFGLFYCRLIRTRF